MTRSMVSIAALAKNGYMQPAIEMRSSVIIAKRISGPKGLRKFDYQSISSHDQIWGVIVHVGRHLNPSTPLSK